MLLDVGTVLEAASATESPAAAVVALVVVAIVAPAGAPAVAPAGKVTEKNKTS